MTSADRKVRKVALVTGASRGIGAAIAEKLGKDGFSLALAARSQAQLHALAERLEAAGVEAWSVVSDLSEAAAPEALVDATAKKFGRLDVIVANAGAAKHGDLATRTDADWMEGFSVKFFAHMKIFRAAWPMLQASHGSIVVIAGIAARTPSANYPIGSAVNAALLGLTKSLADYGRADGIRVNAINPGQIRTDRFAERLAGVMKTNGLTIEQAEQRMLKATGGLRVGEPEDIAGLVAFLVGAQGSYLHGAVLDMDGGMTKGL